MKTLAILILCLLATDATAKDRKLHHVFGNPYVFLPDPGRWNKDHTQYENERLLYLGGEQYYCLGHAEQIGIEQMTRQADGSYLLPQTADLSDEECQYWDKITWYKGKVDKWEGLEIGIAAGSFLFDAATTQRFGTNWEGGCHEVGMMGLGGAHPGPGVLLGWTLLKTGLVAIPALRSPLAYSSATRMSAPTAVFAISALNAGRRNIALGCSGW